MTTLNLTTQLFVAGAWTTYPAYSAEGWEISIGPDLEAGFQPNKLSFALNNDDLSMDPTNPASALYGKVGRNTPARLQLGGVTLCTAEASSWQPDRTMGHTPGAQRGRSVTPIVAEGLLRRLGRWTDPIRSPMTRQTSSYVSLLGFWPLEDPSTAANLSQLAVGAQPGTYSGGVKLSDDDGPGGSDSVVTVGTDGVIGGNFAPSTGNGWQFSFAAKLAALPSSATYQTLMSVRDGDGRTWQWMANNANFQIRVTDLDGAVLDASAAGYGSDLPTGWLRYRLKVTVSGSVITYEPAWYVQDNPTPAGFTQTFAGTTTRRPLWWSSAVNAYTASAAYANVFAASDTTLDLLGSANVMAAFNGYLGEKAGYRFARLMTEEGLSRTWDGDLDKSAAMGRQKPGIFLDLLEECSRTDAGLIYDEPGSIMLTFRMNNYLINRAPVLALTYGTNVAPPLRKIVDDVGVVNDITIKNWDGSEVRVQRTSGRLSTAAPPSGVGRYKGSLDVSFRDPAEPVQRGSWELTNATLDRPRYSAVSVDLLAFPALTATVNAIRPGDLVTLAGVEADTVTLRVMNIERKGGAVEDTATLNCVPGEVWLPGKYNDGVVRYDAGTTTLKTGVTSTATALTFTTVNPLGLWSQTSTPYGVLVAGERITVTAMGAPTGAGPYDQAATVTRSANGVVKAQVAGEPIHIATPGRYAL